MSAKIETKKTEEISTTTNSADMIGKCLAEPLKRGWVENCTDEDTGEVVPLNRYELIFDRGTVIDREVLTKINFFIVEGAIKEVVVSNQIRKAFEITFYTHLWIGIVDYGDNKRRKIIFYANSIKIAYDILVDWYELNFSGSFRILSLKELDNTVVLENLPESDDDVKFYETEVKIKGVGNEFTQTFIVHTSDTDRVIEAIQAFYDEHRPGETVDIKFEQIKIMPYSNVIDADFSRVYMSPDEDEASN